ncbi:amidohydrolase [Hazenella sp. IB182357]|uniref:Amidohydrolase n=1 Tax=Polycladospora coralii TaxID=2771432 RepID=A0A926N7D0_9BACL|nr:amidohydrolase [Polycladospora coralii]MBD1370957.1 amidohydrolase [Polycladospora coralii]MBS7529896.1 amidohydrolase [Polycladospora coralii]
MINLEVNINQLFPQLVKWRRHFHQYPELSFQEIHTAESIKKHLSDLGLVVKKHVGGGGVTGFLQGGKPGPTIALRADMDALPIQDEKKCDYHSRVPGVMHACGHDGHMAMLMGTASILTSVKKELSGNVLFLFQHAEEQLPGGAIQMIEDGVLDDVDLIYGIHLWTPLPSGVIGVCEGEMMAGTDSFEIEIMGKGGHGGLPHEAVDAVVVAAHVTVNLQTLISRYTDPLQAGVISIGTVVGGQGFNVIAERCKLTGTTRSFSRSMRSEILSKMELVIKHTCEMYGATYRFSFIEGYPPVVNHLQEARQVAKSASKIFEQKQIWELRPVMAAEDFSYYLQIKKGSYIFIGAGMKNESANQPHHHPQFDFDEQAMKTGVKLFCQIVLDHLKSGMNPSIE